MVAKAFTSILISGASSGIGRALAEHYAAPGRRLALSGRDAERLNDVADRCRSAGADVSAECLDVADRAAMSDWIAAEDAARALDLVVANAGVSADTAGAADRAARHERIRRVNIDGVVHTVEPIAPRMVARGHGQIALVGSLAGFRGLPSTPAYSASKAWVKAYGEAMRGRLRDTGVGVTVICPGFVESRITRTNSFAMPMLMTAERAAEIVARGLARDRPLIAFPWPMYALARLLGMLPPVLADPLLARAPRKEER